MGEPSEPTFRLTDLDPLGVSVSPRSGTYFSAELQEPSRFVQDAGLDVRGSERGRGLADDHLVAGPTSRTVLVVEDNEANRLLALRQLRVLGCDATAVESGEVALEAVADGRYRLILMDCQMPGMDGLETTREIRKRQGSGPPIPIVAMTANATEHDRQRCIAAGMDDYVTKPVLLEALREVLGRWVPDLGSAEIADPTEASPTPATPLDEIDGSAVLRLEHEVGKAAASRFVTLYLEGLPSGIDAILAATASEDPEALAFAAHTLKSTSATVGAAALASLCEELESIGRAGTTAGAADKTRLLEVVSEQVQRHLRRGATPPS